MPGGQFDPLGCLIEPIGFGEPKLFDIVAPLLNLLTFNLCGLLLFLKRGEDQRKITTVCLQGSKLPRETIEALVEFIELITGDRGTKVSAAVIQ